MSRVLELKGITKTFPGVTANKQINISFDQGEVHCLLGENGAGKTTLMNIVFGLYQPDSGEIYLRGKKIDMLSSAVALRAGIGMVHQHFMLVDPLTVAENVVLGNEPPSRFSFRMDKAIQDVRDISARYGLAVEPTAAIEDLPVGVRQRVEILKALYRNVDILILDEPTAVLSPPEVNELYHTIASLKAAGKTIIFITHKLNETMAVSDRITILRDGAVIQTVKCSETSPAELARMMVGREVDLQVKKTPCKRGGEVLRASEIQAVDNRGLEALRGVNLSLYQGEIYGIAGIEGNGQTELIEVLTGLRPMVSGKITIAGETISAARPAAMLAKGVGHVPEDRDIRGLVGAFSIAENLVLGYHRQKRFQSHGFLRTGRIKEYAHSLIKRFDIRAPGSEIHAASLSGGNKQKVVLARVFSQAPQALIVAQPTRGVDVGATEYIHQQMLAMRDEGAAILLISADLDEIRMLSDRIGVLYQGKIVAEKPAGEFAEQELGLLMAGIECEPR